MCKLEDRRKCLGTWYLQSVDGIANAGFSDRFRPRYALLRI